jgi:hypothetical protein
LVRLDGGVVDVEEHVVEVLRADGAVLVVAADVEVPVRRHRYKTFSPFLVSFKYANVCPLWQACKGLQRTNTLTFCRESK